MGIINKIKILFKTKSQEGTVEQTGNDDESIDVEKFKKECTKIKNEKGYSDAINYLKGVIEHEHLDWHATAKLLNKVIPYMKKEKIDDNAIKDYVDSKLTGLEGAQVFYLSNLYHKINVLYSINYLESYFGSIDGIKDRSIDDFYLAKKLSEYYLQNNQSDKAFQVTVLAGQMYNIYDKFEYLSNEITLSKLRAKICFYGQDKPKYSDYLFFEIRAFIFETCKDCRDPLFLNRFFHRKQLSKEKGFWGKPSKEFELSVKALNIEPNLESFINELNHYTYEEIPLKMGLKEKFLDPEFSENIEPGTEAWDEIMNFNINSEKKPFQLTNEISQWITNFIKKYHELVKI